MLPGGCTEWITAAAGLKATARCVSRINYAKGGGLKFTFVVMPAAGSSEEAPHVVTAVFKQRVERPENWQEDWRCSHSQHNTHRPKRDRENKPVDHEGKGCVHMQQVHESIPEFVKQIRDVAAEARLGVARLFDKEVRSGATAAVQRSRTRVRLEHQNHVGRWSCARANQHPVCCVRSCVMPHALAQPRAACTGHGSPRAVLQ